MSCHPAHAEAGFPKPEALTEGGNTMPIRLPLVMLTCTHLLGASYAQETDHLLYASFLGTDNCDGIPELGIAAPLANDVAGRLSIYLGVYFGLPQTVDRVGPKGVIDAADVIDYLDDVQSATE